MNENLNTELGSSKTDQSKAAVKKDALGLWSSLKIFLIEFLREIVQLWQICYPILVLDFLL